MRSFASWFIQALLLVAFSVGLLFAVEPKPINWTFLISFGLICSLCIAGLYAAMERYYIPARKKKWLEKFNVRSNEGHFDLQGHAIKLVIRHKLSILPIPALLEIKEFYEEGTENDKLLYAGTGSYRQCIKKLEKILDLKD